MPVGFDLQVFPTDHNHGNVVVVVDVGVAHAAAIEDDRVIEQTTVAVRNRLQLLQEVGHRLDVIRIQLRVRLHLLGIVAVVRHRVVRLGQTDLGIRAIDVFPRHHQRADASDVGLERQHLQVEHQLDVLLERWRHADRLLRHRKIAVVRFGLRNALLDVANGVEILSQLRAIARAEPRAELRNLAVEPIEDAAVFIDSR